MCVPVIPEAQRSQNQGEREHQQTQGEQFLFKRQLSKHLKNASKIGGAKREHVHWLRNRKDEWGGCGHACLPVLPLAGTVTRVPVAPRLGRAPRMPA
jgi:hypothetical protein